MKAMLAALCALLLTGLGAYLLGQQHGSARQLVACQLAQQQAQQKQQQAINTASQQEAAARQESTREAYRMQQRATVDATAAERSRIGLQQRAQQLAQPRADVGAPPAAEPAGPPAATAALVLADVLSWSDRRAGEAAAALDAAYAAGLTCEREHDAAVTARAIGAPGQTPQ